MSIRHFSSEAGLIPLKAEDLFKSKKIPVKNTAIISLKIINLVGFLPELFLLLDFFFPEEFEEDLLLLFSLFEEFLSNEASFIFTS